MADIKITENDFEERNEDGSDSRWSSFLRVIAHTAHMLYSKLELTWESLFKNSRLFSLLGISETEQRQTNVAKFTKSYYDVYVREFEDTTEPERRIVRSFSTTKGIRFLYLTTDLMVRLTINYFNFTWNINRVHAEIEAEHNAYGHRVIAGIPYGYKINNDTLGIGVTRSPEIRIYLAGGDIGDSRKKSLIRKMTGINPDNHADTSHLYDFLRSQDSEFLIYKHKFITGSQVEETVIDLLDSQNIIYDRVEVVRAYTIENLRNTFLFMLFHPDNIVFV